MKISKKTLAVGAVLILAALIVWFWMPKPVPVDLVQAKRGPLTVTVDEQGKTRARDRFVIAAPVAGKVNRLDWQEGDPVTKGQVVAWIHPSPLDPRELAEISARIQMTLALQRAAEERVAEARAVHDQARRERERYERLFKSGGISRQTFEQSEKAEVTSASELDAYKSRAQAAAYEVKMARARLIAAEQGKNGAVMEIPSPVNGRVLKIMEKSERVAAAGTPLLVLGDATRLEVVIDLLIQRGREGPAGDAGPAGELGRGPGFAGPGQDRGEPGFYQSLGPRDRRTAGQRGGRPAGTARPPGR